MSNNQKMISSNLDMDIEKVLSDLTVFIDGMPDIATIMFDVNTHDVSYEDLAFIWPKALEDYHEIISSDDVEAFREYNEEVDIFARASNYNTSSDESQFYHALFSKFVAQKAYAANQIAGTMMTQSGHKNTYVAILNLKLLFELLQREYQKCERTVF